MPKVRAATPADASAVAALVAGAGLPLDGLDAWQETTLVIRDGDRLLGCAALELWGSEALLRSVAVADAARGRGLGVELTRAALDLAEARGIRTVFLLTETAQQFFPRFGFRPIQRSAVPASVRQSVEFGSACPASATVMRLDLGRSAQGSTPIVEGEG